MVVGCRNRQGKESQYRDLSPPVLQYSVANSLFMEGPRQRPGDSNRYRRSHSTVESSTGQEDSTGDDVRQQRHTHRRSYSFDAASRRTKENGSSSEGEGGVAGVKLPDRP